MVISATMGVVSDFHSTLDMSVLVSYFSVRPFVMAVLMFSSSSPICVCSYIVEIVCMYLVFRHMVESRQGFPCCGSSNVISS